MEYKTVEYRATVRSANPIYHKTQWTTTELQKAKTWAEGQKKRDDDIVEVVGVGHHSSMEIVSKIWRLEEGRWIEAPLVQE